MGKQAAQAAKGRRRGPPQAASGGEAAPAAARGGQKGKLKVEYVPIERLRAWKGNPRKNAEAVAAVVKSIERFGYANPILVRRANKEIIAGHTRVLALQQLGVKRAPVIFLDLKKTDAHVLSLFDNKSVENTPWDTAMLGEALVELKELGADVELTGFSPEEIQGYTAVGDYAPDPKDDEVPEPPKKAITKVGNLWLLGDHRLACGDCGDTTIVKRVMDGERAIVMNTDPPWGVDYCAAKDGIPRSGFRTQVEDWGNIENDALRDATLEEFLTKAFRVGADEALAENAAWYLWHAHLTQGFFSAAAAAVILHRQIIWVKPHMVLTRSGMYHWKHEPCFYGWRKGHKPPWYGDKSQVSVWPISQELNGRMHPTQKPVELFVIPLQNHTREGEICYDPFAGSGSQFIAAEKLNRRCYGLEIEPRYCDVIVERWEQFTGGKAKRQKGRGKDAA